MIPIWHVSSRSGEACCELLYSVYFTLLLRHVWWLFSAQDMNEPANFGTNEDRPWNWPEEQRPYWSLKCPTGDLDDPPYRTSQCPQFFELYTVQNIRISMDILRRVFHI